MKLLDDLYFYLWDKFLRFSVWICDRIDELAGFGIPNGEDDEDMEEENDEH